jgi:hypothetical protein
MHRRMRSGTTHRDWYWCSAEMMKIVLWWAHISEEAACVLQLLVLKKWISSFRALLGHYSLIFVSYYFSSHMI